MSKEIFVIPDSDSWRDNFEDLHYWAYLVDHYTPYSTTDAVAYLEGLGFDKALHKVSGRDLQLMRWIHNHFSYIKYNKDLALCKAL